MSNIQTVASPMSVATVNAHKKKGVCWKKIGQNGATVPNHERIGPSNEYYATKRYR